MSIIDRYISREITKPFVLLLALLVVIFISFTAAVQLKQAAAGVIPAKAAAQLVLLNTLISLEILLPTTLFFGTIAALGRMQSDFETLTILSAGVTPRHMTFTVLKIALLVAIAAMLLSVFVRPWAYKLSYQLESEAVSKLDITAVVPRRFVNLSSTGHVLYAQGVNLEDGHLDGVFLQHRPAAAQASSALISAKRARLLPLDLDSPPVLQFTEGRAYRLDPHGRRDVVLDFNTLRVPLPEAEKLAEYRRNAVPTAELAHSERPKDVAEYQWRLVTPALTLLLAALTVPLTTSRPRQSGSASIAMALLVYAAVFGVTSVIRTAVEQQRIAALPGLWLALLFPAALIAMASLTPRLRRLKAAIRR